jgi:hypothetical protein
VKFTRPAVGSEAWAVADDHGCSLGIVRPVFMASHIRRGRMQTSPWWVALPAGASEPLTYTDLANAGQVQHFQSRREAAAALRR